MDNHQIEYALENSDCVTVLRQGKILYSDKTSNLDRVSLLRLCYADLDRQDGEDIKREQFYELMYFMEAVMRDRPAAVIVVDIAGRVCFVNNSGTTMFSPPEGAADIAAEKSRRRVPMRPGSAAVVL